MSQPPTLGSAPEGALPPVITAKNGTKSSSNKTALVVIFSVLGLVLVLGIGGAVYGFFWLKKSGIDLSSPEKAQASILSKTLEAANEKLADENIQVKMSGDSLEGISIQDHETGQNVDINLNDVMKQAQEMAAIQEKAVKEGKSPEDAQLASMRSMIINLTKQMQPDMEVVEGGDPNILKMRDRKTGEETIMNLKEMMQMGMESLNNGSAMKMLEGLNGMNGSTASPIPSPEEAGESPVLEGSPSPAGQDLMETTPAPENALPPTPPASESSTESTDQ